MVFVCCVCFVIILGFFCAYFYNSHTHNIKPRMYLFSFFLYFFLNKKKKIKSPYPILSRHCNLLSINKQLNTLRPSVQCVDIHPGVSDPRPCLHYMSVNGWTQCSVKAFPVVTKIRNVAFRPWAIKLSIQPWGFHLCLNTSRQWTAAEIFVFIFSFVKIPRLHTAAL